MVAAVMMREREGGRGQEIEQICFNPDLKVYIVKVVHKVLYMV